MAKTIGETINEFSKRFWSQVEIGDADSCWAWKGRSTKRGYGFIQRNRKSWGAHRIAYLLRVGELKSGLVIAHKCDNKICCNPRHLEQITNAQNVRDAHTRGLSERGEARHTNILTTEQVIEVKKLRANLGWGRVRIARKLNISQNAVKKILEGRTWRHVEYRRAG